MGEAAMWVVSGYLLLFIAGEVAISRIQPQMDEGVILRIRTGNGEAIERTVYGHDFEGHLYVASNHWFRKWYLAALENPEIEVTRDGLTALHRVEKLVGDEEKRVKLSYRMGALRLLTAFAPSKYLRLDPVGDR